MLWSAGLQGFWSDWYPLLWFINCAKTCSTLRSLTSTFPSKSSSCFFVILIFTSMVVVLPAVVAPLVAGKTPSAAGISQSSLSSSVAYLVDDWCLKQFPILGFAMVFNYNHFWVRFWGKMKRQKQPGGRKKEREREREREREVRWEKWGVRLVCDWWAERYKVWFSEIGESDWVIYRREKSREVVENKD